MEFVVGVVMFCIGEDMQYSNVQNSRDKENFMGVVTWKMVKKIDVGLND
jgi:hypothetical protein